MIYRVKQWPRNIVIPLEIKKKKKKKTSDPFLMNRKGNVFCDFRSLSNFMKRFPVKVHHFQFLLQSFRIYNFCKGSFISYVYKIFQKSNISYPLIRTNSMISNKSDAGIPLMMLITQLIFTTIKGHREKLKRRSQEPCKYLR